MNLQVMILMFIGQILIARADYPVSNFPELKIKSAGPSQQYAWVGYTGHFPKTVPRPLLLHKWQPYADPTYTAFWVSEKDSGDDFGAEVKGIDGGGVPHGFGGPKPSSIKGSLIDTFSGPSGSLNTYQEPGPVIGPSDSYVGPSAVGFDDDFAQAPIAAVADVYVQPPQSIDIYQEPQIIQAQPVVHTVDDDFDDGGFDLGGTGAAYQVPGIATGHQEAYIEPGQLVHSEQFVAEGSYQSAQPQSIIPLVHLPPSRPLPLENEGGHASNAILEGVYNIKRSSQ